MNGLKLLLLGFLVSAQLLSQVNVFNHQFPLIRKIDLSSTNFNAIQQTYDKGYIICRGTCDTVQGVASKYTELIKRNREGKAMWAKRLLRDSVYVPAFNTIAQNSQNEVVLASAAINAAHVPEIALVGMDSTGNMLWSKKYPGEGKSNVFKVIPTSDNGYLVIGSTKDAGNVETPYYFKIDNTGNYSWGKKLRLGTDTIGQLYSCIELPGEGYLLAGHSMHKALAIKMDYSGNVIWNRNLFTYYGKFFGVTRVSDGNYIFSGSNADSSVTYQARLLFVKFDPNGNVLWQENLSPDTSVPNYDSYAWCVKAPLPNEFVFSAYISNPIPATLIGKLDLNGNILWTRQYRSTFHTFNYLPTNFETTMDGGFALDIDAGTSTNGASTYSNAFLKLDENGYNDCEGSDYTLQLKTLNYTPTSGINTYSCGTASAYTATLTPYTIRDSVLCETITDHAPPPMVGIQEYTRAQPFGLLQSYPNPSTGSTSINYWLAVPAKKISLEIYDSRGRSVFTTELNSRDAGTYTEKLNLNESPGIYFYSLIVDGNRKTNCMQIE